ncbi:MAG TPA: acyltransferase family protein [Herbaspirillum sp.]
MPSNRGRDPAEAGRYGFIDNAKAIGIVLVVLGHSRGLPEYLSQLIFGFHVPLFFLISGFLLKPGKLDEPVFGHARKTLRALGLPYLVFFAMAWLYWLATRNIGGKALQTAGLAWHDPLLGLFSGLQSDLYIDPPLWFFPCLIATMIVYHAARKFLGLAVSTVLFVALAFLLALLWPGASASVRLPLGLDTMWIALGLFALGQYWRASQWPLTRDRRILAAVFLVGLALLAGAVFLTGRVDLATMRFGALPALYLPMALCGIAATLSISQYLPYSRIAEWLSENTLTIFPAHFLFLSLVRGTALSLHLISGDYQYGIGWSILSSVLAIGLCVPLVWCLRRSPVEIVRKAR